MSTTVNTIKRLLLILLGVFVLTYVISLNMENHFVVANTKWLSNDFLFAISGGIFASLVVVIVCEIIKYYQAKFVTETTLFSNLAMLYVMFKTMQAGCERLLKEHSIVSETWLQPLANNSLSLIETIYRIDYAPFAKHDAIKEQLIHFRVAKYLPMKSIINNLVYFQLAFNEDKMDMISSNIRGNITSDSPRTNKTLKKIADQAAVIHEYIDQFISRMDSVLGNRYNWEEVKQQIIDNGENYSQPTLDDFLKKDVVAF